MSTVKKKAWLYKNGHIKTDGRGRIATVSVKDGRPIAAILEEAVQSGVTFSDFSVDNVVRNSDTGQATKIVKPKNESDGFIEPAPYRYEEDKFKAVEKNGRERSMREVCHGCRVSLVVCWCEQPRIVALPPMMGSVPVTIVPKK